MNWQCNPRIRWVWSALAVLILVGLGYATISRLNWQDIQQALQQANYGWVGIAWATIVIGQWLRLWRAWRLVQSAGVMPWATVARATLGAQVINWLSPLRVGDIWRVWQLRLSDSVDQAVPGPLSKSTSAKLFHSALAITVEKSLDSLALAFMALTLLIVPTPPTASGNWMRLAMTACGAALLLSTLLVLRPDALRKQLSRRFPQLADWGFRWPETDSQQALFSIRDIGSSGCITIAMWLLAGLTNIALAQAFHIAWQGWMIPLLVVGIQTVSIVSPVPGNVGIIPLVTVGVLTLAGLPASLAIAHGTLHYLLAYGTNLGWFIYYWLMRRNAARKHSQINGASSNK